MIPIPYLMLLSVGAFGLFVFLVARYMPAVLDPKRGPTKDEVERVTATLRHFQSVRWSPSLVSQTTLRTTKLATNQNAKPEPEKRAARARALLHQAH